MSLSKPLYTLLGTYLEQLFNHPVRTKSVTSCILAASANVASQKVSGQKTINTNGVVAYGLFGLIFGGTIPHYFYSTLDALFRYDLKFRKLIVFLAERLTFAPFYQLVSLYFLARFEGKKHAEAVDNLKKLYWPLLTTNWKYLSAAVFININFVPSVFRVLAMNLVSFFWVIYMAIKRGEQARNAKKNASP